RYEQPPPGYFDRLSDRISNRLEQEAEARQLEGWVWLGMLRRALAENPVSAGIFAVCGIVMVVVANSQYLDKYVVSGEGSGLNLAAGPVGSGSHDLADNNVHGGLTLAPQLPSADAVVSSVNPVFMNAPDSLLNSLNLNA